MGIGAPKDLSECRRFFLEPANSKHRMYEALRAYFVDDFPPPKWLSPSTTHPDRSKFFAITSAAMPIPTSLSPHALDPAPSLRSPPLAISSCVCESRITR